MKKYSLSLLLFSGLLLGGCTQWVWVKNGEPVSGVEFDRDSLDCKTQASRLFPYAGVSVVTQPAHVIPPSPPQRVCETHGRDTTCVHYPGSPPVFVAEQRQIVDANGASRNDYWRTCMGSKGWAQVDAKTVERDRPVVYIEKPADPPQPAELPAKKKEAAPASKR